MSTTTDRPGGFEIEARLGHRGLVEILLGRAADDPGRLLRLEHLAPASARNPTLRRAMLEAAVQAASVDHANVARTLGVVEDATGIVVVREHLEGATCAELVAGAIRAAERIQPAVAARIVERAARGVHHAHEQRGDRTTGLVHGALAPKCIAVGSDGRVAVHDHGAVGARALRGPFAHLEADAVFGAPEQSRRGTTDVHSDVFSLGMVLYALLRLGTPHGGPEGTAVMGAIAASAMASALADLSDVPGALGPILRRALSSAPSDRFPTAGELADALGHAADALGGAGDREVGALAARHAGAVEPGGDESTRRMGALFVPTIDESSTDAGLDLPTIQRPAPAAAARGTLAAAPPQRPPPPGPQRQVAPVRPTPAPQVAPVRPTPAPQVTATAAAAPLGPGRDEGTPSTDGASSPSRPTPAGSLNAGDRFGRYVIEGRLGRGGTAEVYQAHDTVLQRKVALKLLKSAEDARARERLVREAQAVATFQHPNSVVLFDVGETDGTPYIAMELVRGRTLRAFVGDLAIPLPRRLRWLCAVARALGAAHRQGIVHRDVKPSNVMIREDGEVKVLDFGIARRETSWGPGGGASTLTRQGVIVGTLRYAAPEQLRSEPVDGRADQFAFAMTAYELLAGRPPFTEARAVDVAMRILVDPTPPLASFAPELPEPVASAIDRALSKAPTGRYPTIDELADALEPYAEVLARQTMTAMVAVPAFGTGGFPPVAPGLTGVTHVTSSIPGLPAPPAPPPAKLRPHERALVAFSGVSVALLLVLVLVVVVRARALPAAAAEVAVAQAPPLTGLSCGAATIEAGASADQARAIGHGACARLAIELGVDWGVPGSPAVEVRALPDKGGTTVTLRVGSHEAQGTGATPAEALGAAAVRVAGALRAAPIGPRGVAKWGAADEAGATRIARAWRRHGAALPVSVAVEAQRLIETDRESPVPHALAVFAGAGTSDSGKAAREQALLRLDRLPPSRAHMLRGALLVRPVAADLAEAVRLMRTSYAEAPEDVDMVALYASEAVRLGLPEGFQLVDRLYASAPTRALPALRAAALLAPDRDLPRSQRYAAACVETLPELAASLLVDPLLGAGRLAEARDAVALGKAMGLGVSAGDPLEYLGARIDVALEAGDPAAARDAAKALVADPRPAVQREGAVAVAGSLLAEGKIDEALASLVSESERLESLGSIEGAATLRCEHLRVRRWLGLPVPAAVVARLTAAVSAPRGEIDPALRAEALAEVALATTGPDAVGARAAAARTIDDLAGGAAEGSSARAAIRVRSIALVRVQDGDEAAVALWRKQQGAPFPSLHRAAVDAGLAFEGIADTAAAMRAYRIAETPGTPRAEQAERLIAGARLAALGGDPSPEIASRKARLDRALAAGDADLKRFVEAGPTHPAKGAAKVPAKPPSRGPRRPGR